MSYQVLARKWRPQSFETMVGQSHVLKALSNALQQGRLHHAYLLTGTRGVGKTTIARILARCLNCETGVSATPCGKCSTCLEITEGRSVDLIEVDAASRTKVEDTRELLDNVQYAPSQCRYKIYLIDEVHMLSNHSFNALLKTLEEPPPHVVFLFATTHPQKIPPTVLSRCLQFHLKNLTPQMIVDHLATVFTAEEVSYDDDGLWAIARAASGSMRDALSLSDQAIAFGGGEVMGEAVRTMLGTVDQEVLTELLIAIVDADAKKALAVIGEYAERAPDFGSLIDELLQLLHRLAVEQAVPGAGSEGQVYKNFIQQYAGKVSPEDLQLYYQSILVGKRDLLLAPDPITGLEMIVLRLLAFRIAPEDVLIESLPNSAQEVTSAKKPEAEPAPDQQLSGGEQVPVANLQTAKVQTAHGQTASESLSENIFDNEPVVEATVADAAVVLEPAEPLEPQPKAARSPAAIMRDNLANGGDSFAHQASESNNFASQNASANLNNGNRLASDSRLDTGSQHNSDAVMDDFSLASDSEPKDYPVFEDLTAQRWCEIFSGLPLGGIVRTVASYCVPMVNHSATANKSDIIEFALAEENATMFNDEHPARLGKGLAIYYGKPIEVKINLVADWSALGLAADIETPADYRQRVKAELQGDALTSLNEDENVKAIIDTFDGELDSETIRPLSNT